MAAARHVHDLFVEQDVTNVQWVWTTTGYLAQGNQAVLRAVYPGDHYVDWVGYDPYNFYRCTGAAWRDFEQTIKGGYAWLVANGYGGKPFMIPEYGTQFDPADPARSTQWYESIPQVLRRYPNLKAVIRWDSEDVSRSRRPQRRTTRARGATTPTRSCNSCSSWRRPARG